LKKKIGFYIHIPFCHSKCSYCDFYSISDFSLELKKNYLDRLLKHIDYMGCRFSNDYKPNTLFIGGGTPSIYSAEELGALVKRVQKNFNCEFLESTVEINPNVIDYNFIDKLYKGNFFNRISFGLQSPFKKDNTYLGRNFNEKSVEILKYALSIFENVSIDMVCGYDGFNSEKIIEKLNLQGILPKIKHISLYMLKYSESFSEKFKEKICDDDIQVENYKKMINLIKKNNFKQYEISNFCKTNYECKHNLHYWKYHDYLGVGSNASIKFENNIVCFPKLNDYMMKDFEETIEDVENTEEYPDKIIMRMRLCEGMSFLELKKINPNLPDIMNILYNRYKDCFKKDFDKISFSQKGFIFSNTLLSSMLEIMEERK